MKNSNKLILGLLIMIMVGILSTNMVLKAEFDKINFKDIYHSYSQESLPNFKAVRLEGSYAGLFQIQPGSESEIRILSGEKNKIKWEINGDTLILIYKNDWKPYNYQPGDAFKFAPTAFINTPQVQSIYAKGVNCKITGWDENEWDLKQEGINSGMLLTNNKIENLQAALEEGGLLAIGSENNIKNAHFQIQDTSSFVIEKRCFRGVRNKNRP